MNPSQLGSSYSYREFAAQHGHLAAHAKMEQRHNLFEEIAAVWRTLCRQD
jgi:hypothetical protein